MNAREEKRNTKLKGGVKNRHNWSDETLRKIFCLMHEKLGL